MVSGANTATRTAAVASTALICPASARPPAASRAAVTRCDTGFAATTARTQPGIVPGSTKVLLAMVSGNSTSSATVDTAFGERSTRPSQQNTHDSATANATTSPTASATPATPPCGA